MTVEPIRELNKIKMIQDYLAKSNKRDSLLFNFGINTGLRISDILKLKVCDVLNHKGEVKNYLSIVEKKTGKLNRIKINDKLRDYLRSYLQELKPDMDQFIFQSKKGSRPISRVQAYRILILAARKFGIENFGTHSMRKTWGYWTYKRSKYNIGLIMETFNHSSPRITLRYIGISQQMKDELYNIVQF